MRRLVLGLFALTLTFSLVSWNGLAAQDQQQSQQPESQQGQVPKHQRMQGERLMGTVVSVGANQLQIKKSDGSTKTVQVSDQTRYRSGRQQVQLEDLKAGDHVFVVGTSGDNNTFQARMVNKMTPEMMSRFGNGEGGGGQFGGGMGNPGDRAFGRIESINGNEVKVSNRRLGEQTIEVTNQTQLTKEGQSISLSDLKVGDRIFAMGKQSNGKLVADSIRTGMRRGRARGGYRQGGTPSGSDQQPQ